MDDNKLIYVYLLTLATRLYFAILILNIFQDTRKSAENMPLSPLRSQVSYFLKVLTKWTRKSTHVFNLGFVWPPACVDFA